MLLHNLYRQHDIRAAELITGFVRYAIINVAKMLQSDGAKVLYGDIDSLFISGLDKSGVNIVKEAKENLPTKATRQIILETLSGLPWY